MQKFINNVVKQIIKNEKSFFNTTVVLPSKRSAIFVKNEIKKQIDSYDFLPEILSIEEYIFNISKIYKADNIVLLFELYKIYLENTKKENIETFDQFSNWANILITDFNDLDSYLIDTKHVFTYLKDINRINNWFKKDKTKTELTKKYIHFFENIEIYYNKFYEYLVKSKIGYQGLIYREADKKIDNFILNNLESKYIFIGFNALNKVEINIIQKLLNQGKAQIYFDLDNIIYKENLTAGKFIKHYKSYWKYFNKNEFYSITNEFETEKIITIIGVPKNVSQVKYANELIEKLSQKEKNIALILSNEELLSTTINSLSDSIKDINITMGLPLKSIKYIDLLNLVFKLHQNKSKLGKNNNYYYKDIISLLNHNIIKDENCINAINKIKNQNLIFISNNKIKNLFKDTPLIKLIDTIFQDWTETKNIIFSCNKLINFFRSENINSFELYYLDRLEQLFNQLNSLNNKYNYINSLDGFIYVFKQLIQSETISFKGNAMGGLQIMGMLETRVLEFETVVMTSVNEGFLPAGKSNNSFIPFDIKHEIGLPTYQEKDSIFSYHFFRLISRAKNSYIIYNTETDDFGSGEQSRFITQLEHLKEVLPKLSINKYIISPKINKRKAEQKLINKNKNVINSLVEFNNKGFSPTALTNYIYNPINFYKQKILGLYKQNEIEETIANNTLGTIIHKVLEELYLPFKNKFLEVTDVMEMKNISIKIIELIYKKEYINGDISKGKNLLIFEITKQFINNFLNQEINLLKQGKKLKIINLEVDLKCNIKISDELNIKLIGQADRIDQLDGVVRIIDYKTGKVEQKSLNLISKNTNNWDKLITDYKYSKAFQVLMYAYMYSKSNMYNLDIIKLESGIISFKNLKTGFMKVNRTHISKSDMDIFENELKILLLEIYDLEIPFIENENLPY